MALLDSGEMRVAEKSGIMGRQQWLKQAVLLSFRIHENVPMGQGEATYYDKVPLKFADYDAARFAEEKIRVVPPARYVKAHSLDKIRCSCRRMSTLVLMSMKAPWWILGQP